MGVHPHHPTTIPCRRGRRRSQGRHAPHEVWSAGILARILRAQPIAHPNCGRILLDNWALMQHGGRCHPSSTCQTRDVRAGKDARGPQWLCRQAMARRHATSISLRCGGGVGGTPPTSPHHIPMPARAPALPGTARATRSLVRWHPCPHSPCVAHCAPQPWVHASRKVHIDAPSGELAAALDVSNKRCTSGQGCPRTTMALSASGATSPCNSRLPSQPEL